jgi:hypothetical protein
MDLGVQAIPQFLQQAYQSIGATTAIDQAVKARQIGAAQATAVSPLALQASYQAGAGNVGAIQSGQALSQFGNVLGNIGGQFLGQQMAQENFANLMGRGRESAPENPFQMSNYQFAPAQLQPRTVFG